MPRRQSEWWRPAYERAQWNKWALECYVKLRSGNTVMFEGSQTWPVVVAKNQLYKVRVHGRLQFPAVEPVGRFHGKYLVLHKKYAPRWLKRWASYQRDVYVLDALDRGTLAAHLMAEKLNGRS